MKTGKIAIAITTRNRPDTFIQSISQHKKYTPFDIFIIDDCSDTVYTQSDYRFLHNAGIPVAKNKCLELLMKTKADHFFLFDDDTFPISEKWWVPYINSGVKHLNFTFATEPYYITDKGIKLHYYPNGCMMYIHRSCVDVAGGFDINYGLGKYEHVDFTRRVYNIGLTEHPFADVVGSDRLLYCLDKDKAVTRTLDESTQKYLLEKNRNYFVNQEKSIKFVPYENNDNIICNGV